MGLFGSKESKEQRKETLLNNYLEMNKLSELNNGDKEVVKEILKDYSVNTLMRMGAIMKSDSTQFTAIQQNEILIQQNWLIIRKLNELCNKLDK